MLVDMHLQNNLSPCLVLTWPATTAIAIEFFGRLTLFCEVDIDMSPLALKLWFLIPKELWYRFFVDLKQPNFFEEVDVPVAMVLSPVFVPALAAIQMPFLHSNLVQVIKL